MPASTTRWGLPYPLGTESADGPNGIEALAVALDSVAMDDQGILSNRPVSTSGTPGKKGRYYMVKGDSTTANNGILWRDNGTGWDQVGGGTIFDTRANRPAAGAVPLATRFFATDQIAEWITNGTTWIRMGAQVGEGGFTMLAAATPGKILLQGQTWPATTGIYADLYALLGGSGGAFPTHLPDFTMRVPVGYKSADPDVGVLLAMLGEKTHALTVAELATHHHTEKGTDVVLVTSGGGTGHFETLDGGDEDGPDTGDTGSGTPHNNMQPSIVVNYEAKL